MRPKQILNSLVAGAVVALFFLHWQYRPPGNSSISEESVVTSANEKAALGSAEIPTEKETETERRARMISGSETNRAEFKLTPQEIYSYLQLNRSNALSLVAAFQLSQDRDYLRAAAERYPNDPMVQAQVILFNLFPEERGKWIKALKDSAPGNSLGNLLAAREAVEKGDMQGALAEAKAAQGKAINDFKREAMQGMEEAYLAAGRTTADAKALGSSELFLQHYSQIKALGNEFIDAARAKASAGDAAAQAEFLTANWNVAKQFREMGQNGTILSDLVGLAMENKTLRAWPAGTPAPFLEGTTEEALAANMEHRKDIKSGASIFGKWFPTAPDFEIINYMDRQKAFGELNAMRWLRERHPELAEAPQQ